MGHRRRPRRLATLARHGLERRDVGRVRRPEDALGRGSELDEALDRRLAVAHAGRRLPQQDLPRQRAARG